MQVFNRKGTKTCRYLKANRTLICWLLSRKISFKGRLDKLEAQLQNDIASRLPYIDYCDYSNYNDCVDGNWGEDDWNDNWNDKNE